MNETMFRAYVECALWASTDEDGEPLDGLYGPDDLSDVALAAMSEDCRDFLELLEREEVDLAEWSSEQLGHDFWLTRNRHGAGFWDRGRASGDRLTELCRPYGESDLYVGDDGYLYVSP